jgi:hypothetical protein
MKILIFISWIIISLLSSGRLLAQIDTVFSESKPRTVIEEYTLKSSILFKREFIDIGTTNKLTVQVLKLTNMSNEITISGIKLSWVLSSLSASSYYPRSSFIDRDEIDDLSNSIFKMTSTLNQIPPINYTEYNFITKSGFEVGILSQGQSKQWRAYVKNEFRNSQILFNINELQKLQQLLQIAKSQL